VLGPLAATSEPHTYDLCQAHAQSLTAPRGWELVRHEGDFRPPPAPADDLLALADAVLEPATKPTLSRPSPRPRGASKADSRRGHLRSIPSPDRPGPPRPR
jgi:hypothetical protein